MRHRLVEIAGRTVKMEFVNAFEGGLQAGRVFVTLLAMRDAGVRDAGLDKAQHSVATLLPCTEIKGKRGGAVRRSTVAENWQRYRKVAHVWAGLDAVMREAVEARGSFDPVADFDCQKIAAIADALKQTASAKNLPRGRGSILPVGALEIIGSHAAALRPVEKEQQLLTSLASFASRTR